MAENALRWLTKRSVVRGAFLAFFVYACVRLWLFARWCLGVGPYVTRPESVVGIIPIGAFGSFFAWLRSGVWDTVLPAGLVIIIGALATSTLFKRGFCGWICPVGAVAEYPAWLGRRLLGRRLPKVPRWLDLVLRGVRYAIAAAAIYLLGISLAPSVMIQFRNLPYYAAADVKILSYFVHPPAWWLATGVGLFGLSVPFGNVWCRWVCPLGGLYGAVGIASPCTVVRDEGVCTSCRKCARACHASVPVDRLRSVRAPECDGCMECVKACPEPGALQARLAGRVALPPSVWPLLVVALWLAVYFVALSSGNWHAGVPVEGFRAAVQSLGIVP